MAKAPLSKTDMKAKKADLKTALATVNAEHGKFVSDHKAAEKALATIKQNADKVFAALKKTSDKEAAAAQKLVDAAAKKLEKATAAAEKGRAKIAKELADLEPAVNAEASPV